MACLVDFVVLIDLVDLAVLVDLVVLACLIDLVELVDLDCLVDLVVLVDLVKLACLVEEEHARRRLDTSQKGACPQAAKEFSQVKHARRRPDRGGACLQAAGDFTRRSTPAGGIARRRPTTIAI